MARDRHHDLLDLTLCSFAGYIISREAVTVVQARQRMRTALLATVTEKDTICLRAELQALISVLLSPEAHED